MHLLATRGRSTDVPHTAIVFDNGGMRAISIGVLVTVFTSGAFCQEFEVVSVRPNHSLSGNSGVHTDQGMLKATNVSLRSLIVRAYGLKDYQVEGPDWLASERFDIAAKLPEGLPKDRDKYEAAQEAMLRSMLLDRFMLRSHREQKTFSVFGLIIARSGIKFKEVPNSDTHSQNSSNTHYTGTCVSMDAFAGFLSRRTDLSDLPVLDMTGLKGFYDLKLDWIPESGQSADTPAVGDTASGPTLRVALEDQLGLKLEARKAPIEILIVDHAEKAPSEN
jgi:uncharacterized protein (TIGR03435 family)